ncbi:MAG: Ig-like domain-containing protein, partial [Oscillospiraceae bacterium]|nr:Ig-like domain-containing protein [Oscillospiraceae bacterium]
MKYTGKNQFTDRVLAVLLSLLIILATIPIRVQSVEAATETYPDDYTVTVVKDKDLSTEEPIEGASVWYTVEVSQDGGVTWVMTVEESVTPDETDASGTVVISGVASEEGDFVADLTQVKITYRISMGGYDEYSNELSPTILTDVTHLENDEKVELTEAPLEDLEEGTDYTISGLTSDYDGTAHPVVVTVTADECIVSYSEDGGTNWSGVAPTITDAGSKTIKIRIENPDYNTLTLDVTLTVNKVDRDDFAFATPFPTDIEYETDLTYSNVATSSQEPQAVTYGSSDTTIATVDSAGLVTFLEAGTVSITASMLGSDNYYASTAKYSITATPMTRPDLYFETSVPSAMTYSSGLTFSNNAIDDVSDGTILYSIVSQRRDDLDVNDVATIDSNTGVLSINASGVVIVKAEVTGGSYYRDDEAEYSLTINRATQTGFAFATPTPAPLPYKSSIQNVASGGQGTGEITYVINQAYPIIEFEEDGDNNGKIKAIGIGNASVYATKAADTRYLEVTKYYNITTIKADQTTFVLSPSGAQTVNYGTQTYQLNVSGGESTGIVSYAVVGSSDVGSVDQTGLVTFKDNKKGTLEIVATKQGDNYYNVVQSTITFTVVSNVSDQFSISGDSLNPGWYIGTVTVSPTSPMTRIGYSGTFFSEWLYNLQFVNEGTYSDITFYLKHWNQSIYGPNTLPTFRIDTIAPTIPDITYSTAILDTVLEAVTFGFYDAPVTVTVTSSDETSGIDHFGYNLGNGEVIIPKDSITFDGRNATATFTIDPQYKGMVAVTAYDEAGLSTTTNKGKVLVVDNVAPGVTVTFDNNSATNTNYYKAPRTATIRIVEENFYPEDVVITVGKRLNNETVYTESRIEPDFTKEGDTHVATVLFDEDADYTFDISYTDKSGNVYDDYVQNDFTIDQTSPVLTMTGVNPNKYYQTARTVTLTVTEHNFNAADFIFTISGVDVQGNDILITEDYTSFL